MRVFSAAGLCFVLSACADDGAVPPSPTYLYAAQADAGADADAGPPAEPCDWYVKWLTMVDQEGLGDPCVWGMRTREPGVALLRSNAGNCLAPTSMCGVPACIELVGVAERQVIEVWGPSAIDADTVWFATDSYDCE